jgi:hypothetical protein
MEIKIGRSSHTCALCEADFVHESPIHSLVRVVEDQFVREDYCTQCDATELIESAYSTWTAQYYDPKIAEQEPEESFSPLRQAFYTAAEDSKNRASLAVAYLAAQLLRRQKVFRLIKESKDLDTEESLILFNDRIGNRLIEVSDPTLSHAELDAARGVLMEALLALEAPDEPETEGDVESDATDSVVEGSTDQTDAEKVVEDEEDFDLAEDEYDEETYDEAEDDQDIVDPESEDHATSQKTA